jgi:putative membrane protein
LDKSKNNDVRAFAQQMVGDHTMVNNQALALVKKLNVKPSGCFPGAPKARRANREQTPVGSCVPVETWQASR